VTREPCFERFLWLSALSANGEKAVAKIWTGAIASGGNLMFAAHPLEEWVSDWSHPALH
jgi:hypothetical protein